MTTPARLAARRPFFRCLHAPSAPIRPSNPQLRHLSKSSPDAESLLNKTPRPGKGPQTPQSDFENVSIHRAEAMRRAKLIRKRNWLALGAALSMIAPIFLVRLWDIPEAGDDAENPGNGGKNSSPNTNSDNSSGSRGILDLFSPPPTKADSPQTPSFQGKKVVVAAGDKIIAAPPSSDNPQPTDADAIELVETGTSYVPYFPKTIMLPTNSPSSDTDANPSVGRQEAEYTLLGLGIRKVSFLRVQVYVVGLYIRTSSLAALQNHLINTVNPTASALIPGEKEDLRKALLDPEQSAKVWDAILSDHGPRAVESALRIVPVRGTDFKHLQDGWMRGVAGRTDEVRRRQMDLMKQDNEEKGRVQLPQPVDTDEFSDESFGAAMKDFKALFHGRGKAPKGSVILLQRNRVGELDARFQGVLDAKKEVMQKTEWLGRVPDERVSRLVWLLYLGGENVSSEDARRSVVEGCVGIVERPVGTVEGMVS